MKRTPPAYLAHTQPGFEAIAADEIARQLEGAAVRGTRVVADKNGMVLFDYRGDVRDLLSLRTIEDLFVLVATLPDLPPTREGPRLLETTAARAPTFEAALQMARQLQPGRGGRGKLHFRVVARQIGQTAYRRVDAQRAVERGIMARSDRQWRLDDEGALEFWLTLLPGEALLALRLSDERMRHRDYKLEHLPASLRPSAAAALVWLAQPRPDDVFLDPMCGAGTILIERAQAGRYQLLLGGDVREEAVAVTLRNIGPRYKPIEVRRWDARSLPLDAASVSAAAVNLPFGKQIGTLGENRTLYPQFLREMARVLRPGARLVALTGDRRTFAEALRRATALAQGATYPVRILGQPASVYVVERT
ncbi:MAG: RNA methyltransferase [Chloroflexota bacterium]|nr:RNA methyltransferase [Chloroflexota bacterium]